jgi:DNA polymerase (family 10)
MTNREIALILFNIATLLELAEANPYRVRAYRRAARSLLRLRESLAALSLAERKRLKIPGVGKRLGAKIAELIDGGRMAFYEELVAEQHPAVQALMTVAGVGPKTAFRLFAELHVTTPAELLLAAQRGQVRQLWGFAERREQALARAAAEAVARAEVTGVAATPALPAAA